jgi:hypothetical protein
MNIFKTTSEAESAINKLLPILLTDKEGISSVSVSLTPTGEDNEYYVNIHYFFDGNSFDRQIPNRITSSRRQLKKRVKDYLGIKLIMNKTSVNTEK